MIKAVVFDVGETLVDETREYGTWADWLNVPRHYADGWVMCPAVVFPLAGAAGLVLRSA